MNPWSAIVYTVAALLFFGLGYVTGNSMGDAATFRDCAYGGRAALVSGGSIKCSIERMGEEPPPAPQDSRPKPDRPFPPAGFEKSDQG